MKAIKKVDFFAFFYLYVTKNGMFSDKTSYFLTHSVTFLPKNLEFRKKNIIFAPNKNYIPL